jgi:ClpP class serine protease
MEILWILIAIAMAQPAIKRQMLEASRKRLIAKLEAQRGSRVILMAHRQETMSFLGFPLMRYIDINDSEEVLRAIHLTDPQVPVDIILHTPGGLVLACFQIARTIHRHPGKVTVFVPHYAMSGGTLIALSADQIVLSPHAILGPVDPQIDGIPAAAVVSAVEQKRPEDLSDETLMLAHSARRALEQVQSGVCQLLVDDMPREKALELAKILSQGTWTHDHGITFEEAQALGLPVSLDMPAEVMQLMTLFPQPVRREGAVEYLPIDRTRRGAQPSTR